MKGTIAAVAAVIAFIWLVVSCDHAQAQRPVVFAPPYIAAPPVVYQPQVIYRPLTPQAVWVQPRWTYIGNRILGPHVWYQYQAPQANPPGNGNTQAEAAR